MLLGTFYLLQMTKYLKNQFSHLVTLTTAVRLLCKRLRRTTTTRRRSARSRNVQCQIVLCRAVGKRPLFCSQPTNNGLTQVVHSRVNTNNKLSIGFFVSGTSEPRRVHFNAIIRKEDRLNHIYRIAQSIPDNPVNEILSENPVLTTHPAKLENIS